MSFESTGCILPFVKINLHVHHTATGENALGAGLVDAFSTDGTNVRSTFWPTSELVNSMPRVRAVSAQCRIQTSANCPNRAFYRSGC